ncbi:MAG: radical SAM family heme chaperone HemW [Bacteroidales bacterium]|nr:radical SAM family heme chaperone HemW [Bacteroidales bacterium]
MAGVYVHIPFCLKICGYCDFYRVAGTELVPAYIDSLLAEMEMRSDYLQGEAVDTIYFGGGTPSVLSLSDTERIVQKINALYKISPDAEITVEVNPDDLDLNLLRGLKSVSFNRLSIGIQSWSDSYLKMLNRRHDAAKAEKAITDALAAGFDNLSVDLIYGLPGMSTGEWEKSLEKTFQYGIKHLSAYHLSVEKGTPFYKMVKAGLMTEIDEEESNNQFLALVSSARRNDFIHYEISNFCREGFYSRHNTSYWRQVPYVGFGPSAHSFNGYSRQWNVSNLKKYISAIKKGELLYESEEIDFRKRFNEYIMTSLRTMWGIDLEYVERNFEKEGLDYITNLASRFVTYGMMRQEKNSLILTDQGVMTSDNIISGFMMT